MCLHMHIAFLTVEKKKKKLQKSRFILKETDKSSTMLTPLLEFLQLPHEVCSTCQRNLSTLPVTVGATEALTCDSLLNICIKLIKKWLFERQAVCLGLGLTLECSSVISCYCFYDYYKKTYTRKAYFSRDCTTVCPNTVNTAQS